MSSKSDYLQDKPMTPVEIPMLHRVQRALKRMIPQGATVLVGVSGGPDSQALLSTLAELQSSLNIKKLYALGVNHQLRSEATCELAHAERLAARLNISFSITHVAVSKRGNLLHAARSVRYAALKDYAQTVGATHIALGHNANDQVETVLWRLLRGSSMSALGGIPKKRGLIIRPLHAISREAIVRYLTTHNISYATDPSNMRPERMRGLMRTQGDPLFKKFNIQYAQHIYAFSERVRRLSYQENKESRAFLHTHKTLFGENISCLNSAQMLCLNTLLQNAIWERWLQHNHVQVTSRRIARMRHAAKHAPMCVGAKQGMFFFEKGCVWFRKTIGASAYSAYDLQTVLSVPTQIVIKELDLTITCQVENASAFFSSRESAVVSHQTCDSWSTWVSFDACQKGSLQVRPWREGDAFQPLGMVGHMNVGDLFTNLKVPRALRDAWPVFTLNGEAGETIVWIAGLRRSAYALMSSDASAHAHDGSSLGVKITLTGSFVRQLSDYFKRTHRASIA